MLNLIYRNSNDGKKNLRLNYVKFRSLKRRRANVTNY